MKMARRTFLQSLTAAASIGAAQKAFSKPEDVVVGAHPWVYAATQPNYDITPILDRIFADMKYAGMEGVELMHTALRPDDSVQRISKLIEEHELPVIGTSFSGAMWDREQHDAVLKDATLVVTRLGKLGGKTLGTSVGRAKGMKTAKQLDAQAELLRKIIAICEDNGVTLNLHNHTYEVENDLHDLKGTLERIPDVKLGPDLDWLVQADVDPVWFIRTYGDQIAFLHLRDQYKDKTWCEAMGEGDMDYEAVAAALRDIDFKGHAVIELAHPKDLKLSRPLRESLKISRRYVQDVLGY